MKGAIALLTAALALSVWAADEPKSEPASQDNFFKRAAKVIGHDAKTGAHLAGQSIKETGKAIGHGTTKTVKDIGNAMKESAEETKKEAKETFK
jgi:hypothetical protein